jgi:hypothetical protein
MAVTQDQSAPYAPPSAVLAIIERYRERGLPTPVNSDVLGRAGVSDSLIPRTLQALQTLDLIDEQGRPTQTLESIRLAPAAQYEERLREWLNGVYADVLMFIDPATADEVQVRDAFRSYEPVGQQARMVSLFRGLYAAAGVAGEKAQVRQPRQQRSTQRTIQKSRTPANSKSGGDKGQTVVPKGIPAPIAGLLASLPPEGGSWTQAQHDKFTRTFSAILDFCFQIVEEGRQAANDIGEYNE